MKEGISANAGVVAFAVGAGAAGAGAAGAGAGVACAIPACRLAGSLQAQHLFSSGASQADFSHCNSHLGLAQLVGLMHLWKQERSSQTGAHLGAGASHVV